MSALEACVTAMEPKFHVPTAASGREEEEEDDDEEEEEEEEGVGSAWQ